MTLEADSTYRSVGAQNRLALEVRGPTVESCLARAVEAFGSYFADVHPSIVGRDHTVELRAPTASGLLVAVLEESLRLGRDGEVAIGMHATSDGERSHTLARFEAVPLTVARAVADFPPVLAWHSVTLEPEEGQWRGRVIAAL